MFKYLKYSERPLFTATAILNSHLTSDGISFDTPALSFMTIQPQLGYVFDNFTAVATCGKETFYKSLIDPIKVSLIADINRENVTKKPLQIASLEANVPAQFYFRTNKGSQGNKQETISLYPTGFLKQTPDLVALGELPKLILTFVCYEITTESFNTYQGK